ncbi:protein-export membrane protein SecDF [Butyrivibrio proteoclasticus B316]|uniref:Multifunctional fusion protein n=1 Tax=Butyrivibrio proteoclasticus (strain ATCC 51982 / DSM 14932 / B316) TaxID=515622 RepID=E0RYN5_BUTPB|nr:protein translocase subunit SecDF [Butyrivibrio proteoclasticus]ADL34730.1 protein-export membrane protein SecDF [Butyrivibrio proteoclasticus B316]
MKRLKSVIGLILMLALLGGLGYSAVVGLGSDKSGSLSSIPLGLDLAGGVSITYEVVGDENPDKEDMSDTIYKLQQRVDQYSTESLVYQEGSNRINIEIPGVSDANAILEELGQPGNLYFIAQTDSEGNPNYEYKLDSTYGLFYTYELSKTIEELEADGSIVLSGSDVETAQAVYQQDSYGGNEPVVSLDFTDAGAAAFAEATTKAYANGESIGIYYDGQFISVPKVQAAITDGKAVITGMTDYENAANLASMIRIGGLKLQLNELRSNVVGAQLGSDAIRTSLYAAAVGFALIAVFMIVFFRVLGLSATLALAFYSSLMVFMLSAFEQTLTLPGIAGIILSIGMAVDANVLVFSRIKEEIAGGKDVNEARKAGYNKALSSIIDGNVTTFIVAFWLFILGTGSIKGFAITLMFGIVLSMFTALVITRTITSLLYGIGLQNPVLYGKAKAPVKFDFVGKRKVFYGVSCAIVIAGFIAMGVNAGQGKGAFNYSLDFVGGTSTTVTFSEAKELADLEKTVAEDIKKAAGINQIQIQTVTGTNQVIFKTSTLDVKQREAVEDVLVNNYEVSADNIAAETISSVISSEMRVDAIIALLVSLVCMLIYIWIRFKDIKFGAAAIIALAHDALIVIVSYAFTRYAVGNTFIAVVLTIIGYSINDTIVTFDRIRENLANATSKKEYADLVNGSVAQTVTRSLFTSATTFFTVCALYAFGVADIKAFALPLMVGVICGTYSSIFIASPMWYDLKTKFKTLFTKQAA